MRTCLVHIHKPVSATHECMLPSKLLCCICQRQKLMCMLQAEPPSAAEVAHDPRLERVIGAILSGAGDPLSPPSPGPFNTCSTAFRCLSQKHNIAFIFCSCLANSTAIKAFLVCSCQAGKLCTTPTPPPPLAPLLCFTTHATHCSYRLSERAHRLPQFSAIDRSGRLDSIYAVCFRQNDVHGCCGCTPESGT